MKIIPKNTKVAYDKAIVMGRWQIPHHGHLTLFKRALEVAASVIVVLGSAKKARDSRNPFTADERREMVLRTIPEADHSRVSFVDIRDYYSTPRWAEAVRREVRPFLAQGAKVCLVGYQKDSTSQYLRDFPEWRLEDVAPEHSLDATALRKVYFTSEPSAADAILSAYVSERVLQYLQAWRNLPYFKAIAKEFEEVALCQERWGRGPHLTGDAIVQVGDYFLMTTRQDGIGEGLYAWPGAFNTDDEQLLSTALRAVDAKTRLGFPVASMLNALQGSVLLDHPLRSPRGRIVSTAFYFKFPARDHLPEVHSGKGSMNALWVPRSDLAGLESKMFEDHFMAVDHFAGVLAA